MGLAFWRRKQVVAPTVRAGSGSDKESEGAEQEALLRRRTRQRLIGATVLLLAAVVIVPMILETDPRAVPDNVQIVMPTAAPGSASAPVAPAATPSVERPVAMAPDAPKSDAQRSDQKEKAAETKRTEPQAAEPAKAADVTKSSQAPKAADDSRATETPKTVEAKAPVASAAAEKQTGSPPAESRATANPKEDPIAALLDARSAATGGRFALQAAALSSEKAARELAGRLKQAGFKSYVEPVKTGAGTAHRVRVGPFDSKASADKAREALRAAGFAAVVVDA